MSKVKYDYSLLRVDYPKTVPKTIDIIRIICSLHGEFNIKYAYHKRGGGCRQCLGRNYSLSKEICVSVALKYKRPFEFQKKSRSEYDYALKNGFLSEITSHMKRNKPNGYWNLENCLNERLKYKSDNEWRKKSQISYQISLKNNWLDIISNKLALQKRRINDNIIQLNNSINILIKKL